MRLLGVHQGLVHAPLPQVRDLVLSTAFSASATPLRVRKDAAQGWIEARGQWWWCGRVEVHEHAAGARVVYRIYNVATGLAGRLVPVTVARGHRGPGPLLAELGERLGCRTELL
ncbi:MULTISPECIES: hypothetical protein [Amycolatopsis]|uniref:hypothetical protein n=1 Tax=Amycolatopsis TaxID=1813 RepID=UPI001178C23E|nr:MULTISPECIES: hypothetical protein [Amycolatopsis]